MTKQDLFQQTCLWHPKKFDPSGKGRQKIYESAKFKKKVAWLTYDHVLQCREPRRGMAKRGGGERGRGGPLEESEAICPAVCTQYNVYWTYRTYLIIWSIITEPQSLLRGFVAIPNNKSELSTCTPAYSGTAFIAHTHIHYLTLIS